MRKVCVITGTRAEFGLLHWVIQGINSHSKLALELVATGMHLSPEFGLTYKAITDSGFIIDKKIEMLLSSDTSVGIAKSMGLGMISFGEFFEESKPDIVLVLGDRFEIFSAVSAAMVSRIPIAHIHGGEATEGLIDESIRHSITKMAHIHFTANEEYKKRVIQLGEQPNRVFNVGSPGLDNIKKLNLLTRDELEVWMGFEIQPYTALVTFHPVTLENATSEAQFENLLNAISEFPDLKVIFTKPNADTDGRVIIDMIDNFVKHDTSKYISFVSLGQLRYLSCIQFVDVVIGNSSSGLTEVPSFKIPTINIGDRQRGRLKATSVIDCQPTKESIAHAIHQSRSLEMREILSTVSNPYGDGGASDKIIEILADINLADILKKKFYNL